jgi:hypothetical protein
MTDPMQVLCPRCRVRHFTPYNEIADVPREAFGSGEVAMPPALSRIDNETYICSECGTAEAMRDLAGVGPIPPYEWPVLRYGYGLDE